MMMTVVMVMLVIMVVRVINGYPWLSKDSVAASDPSPVCDDDDDDEECDDGDDGDIINHTILKGIVVNEMLTK